MPTKPSSKQLSPNLKSGATKGAATRASGTAGIGTGERVDLRSEAQQHRALIVGRSADVPRAIEHPAFGVPGSFNVVAVADVSGDDDASPRDIATFERLMTAHAPDTIVVAGPVGQPLMARIGDLAVVHRCRLLAVMPAEVLAGHRPVVVWEGDSPLVQLAHLPRSAWQLGAKRAMDVVGALIGLSLSAPIIAAVALLIQLESPGSPLFAHVRVGRGGRRFRCWKLRTMRLNAEDELQSDPELLAAYRENDYKLPDDQDPRVTRLGRFVRRASLDELPQFWNVLVGEMSLVGPRPVVPEELRHFAGAEDVILSVRPGMSGAWAVNGRHHVGYPERAHLELRYARTASLSDDVSILIRTIGAVLDPSAERRSEQSH
jgi:exopolysaccharide production protein ExoY